MLRGIGESQSSLLLVLLLFVRRREAERFLFDPMEYRVVLLQFRSFCVECLYLCLFQWRCAATYTITKYDLSVPCRT